MQNQTEYSRTQIALHWAIVVLLLGQYLLHGGIEAAWAARMEGSIPNEPFPNPHAIVGLIIFVLALWRVVLRVRHGAPALPEKEPAGLKLVAKAVHLAFYALLIGMPISGAVAWVAGIAVPADVHGVAAKILLGLIVLHVVGAIAQKVWFKTDVLIRMSPKRMWMKGGAR